MTALEHPRWLALSKGRREKLLDEYRDVNTDHDWWDCTYEDFEQQLAEVGITVSYVLRYTSSGRSTSVPEIYFSGFGCRGDNAWFFGHVSNWPKFLLALGRPTWARWAETCAWDARSMREGTRYSVVDYHIEPPENPHDEEDDPLRFHAWQVANNPPSESEIDDFITAVLDKFRDLCQELYKTLEAEYEYLTADEQIVDWLLNNLDELDEDDEDDD